MAESSSLSSMRASLAESSRTRRTALSACESCRQRKSKCDEGRPTCSRCERLQLICVYDAGGSKYAYLEKFFAQSSELISLKRIHVGTPYIRESLDRIESKLDKLSQLNSSLHVPFSGIDNKHALNEGEHPLLLANVQSSNEAHTHGISESLDLSPFRSDTALSSSTAPRNQAASFNSDEEFVLAIPFKHNTAPQNILFWPCMEYTPVIASLNYPLMQELARDRSRREPLQPVCLATHNEENSWLDNLTLPQIRLLVQYYFEDIHPHAPIFNRVDFQQHILGPVLNEGFGTSLETCIVLLVFALGSLSAVDHGKVEWLDESTYPLGIASSVAGIGRAFFNKAMKILEAGTAVTWTACQAHILAGIYQSHQMLLYDHWYALHQASITIMILLQNGAGVGPRESHIYWVAYLQESQILAELDLPPSGISRYESVIPLPFKETDSSGTFDSEYEFVFLAQIALRRLLNRIHSNLYNTVDEPPLNLGDNSSAKGGFPPLIVPSALVLHELDHQLETWRAHLPPAFQFPDINSAPPWQEEGLTEACRRTVRDKLLASIKARYCAAKAIIFRPFIYKVLHTHERWINEEDLRGAEHCLKAAFRGPLYSGILSDSFKVMPVPIYPCRSFFATTILIKLLVINDKAKSVIPEGWDIIDRIQSRLELEVAPMSPIVKEDMRILRRLDEIRGTSSI